MRTAISREMTHVSLNPAQKRLHDVMRREAAQRAGRAFAESPAMALYMLRSDVLRLITDRDI